MKKRKIFIVGVVVLGLSLLLTNKASHSLGRENLLGDEVSKYEVYDLILNNQINLQDAKMLDVLTNWYSYFEIEDMFLTKDGEYIDYTTYEIYRVHLENQYKKNKEKIAKKLLKAGNYPREENVRQYEDFINEYINTTGNEI